MVRISKLLQENFVIDDIKATDKDGVLREFAGLLKASGTIHSEEEIIRVLAERESLGSTGIGDGVAIPHGKVRNLRDAVIAFGRSRKGVDFDTMDGKPAYLFFLLLSPEDRPGDHLKILARISRILKNPGFREKLRSAPQGQELQRMILEEDGKYPQR